MANKLALEIINQVNGIQELEGNYEQYEQKSGSATFSQIGKELIESAKKFNTNIGGHISSSAQPHVSSITNKLSEKVTNIKGQGAGDKVKSIGQSIEGALPSLGKYVMPALALGGGMLLRKGLKSSIGKEVMGIMAPTAIASAAPTIGKVLFKNPNAFNPESVANFASKVTNQAYTASEQAVKQSSSEFIPIEEHPDYKNLHASPVEQFITMPLERQKAATRIDEAVSLREYEEIGKHMAKGAAPVVADHITEHLDQRFNPKSLRNTVHGLGVNIAGGVAGGVVSNTFSDKPKEKKSNTVEDVMEKIVSERLAIAGNPLARATHRASSIIAKHPNLTTFGLGAIAGTIGPDVIRSLARVAGNTVNTIQYVPQQFNNPYSNYGNQNSGYGYY